MAADIRFVPDAAEDYIALDGSVRIEVRKAIEKLKVDPRGYGEPLGNRAGINLFGFFSIRAGRRVRLIYSVEEGGTVVIRVIGRRDRFEAHQTARERISEFVRAAAEELRLLDDVLKAAGDE